jgi:hypothetical protein
VEQTITEREGSRADRDNSDAEFVRTQLELAFSLLDIAAVTERPKIVRGCVHNAVAAVRTAARFLADAPGEDQENSDIWQRQDELVKRVREVARHHRAGRSPHATGLQGRQLS